MTFLTEDEKFMLIVKIRPNWRALRPVTIYLATNGKSKQRHFTLN